MLHHWPTFRVWTDLDVVMVEIHVVIELCGPDHCSETCSSCRFSRSRYPQLASLFLRSLSMIELFFPRTHQLPWLVHVRLKKNITEKLASHSLYATDHLAYWSSRCARLLHLLKCKQSKVLEFTTIWWREDLTMQWWTGCSNVDRLTGLTDSHLRLREEWGSLPLPRAADPAETWTSVGRVLPSWRKSQIGIYPTLGKDPTLSTDFLDICRLSYLSGAHRDFAKVISLLQPWGKFDSSCTAE